MHKYYHHVTCSEGERKGEGEIITQRDHIVGGQEETLISQSVLSGINFQSHPTTQYCTITQFLGTRNQVPIKRNLLISFIFN